MGVKPKRRQVLDLDIEKVAFGGKGVARSDDFVIFVERTLPGDRVRARIRKVRKGYAEAVTLELLHPSPLRQPAPCAHFGYCGGCKWQNVAYERQLQFKKGHVLESLKHIGAITPDLIHDPVPAPAQFGYRNKMEFSFSDNRWLTPDELKNPEIKKGFALGLHVPGFFDRILDIEKCWLQDDLFNDLLAYSKSFFRESGLSVYNVHRKEGVLRYLVLRRSEARKEVMINLVSHSAIPDIMAEYGVEIVALFPAVVSIYNTINDRVAQIATGDQQERVHGSPVLIEEINGLRFEISPDSFFQTNSLQAATLYQWVQRFSNASDQVVWDLYSGTGSIAITLASTARRIVGFEIVENAVKDAYRNAKLNGVANCEFVAGDLRHSMRAYTGDPPDVIICDPPRAGMHADVLQEILRVNAKRIVYVSCNPATMARDLNELVERYQLLEVVPVDMFPHTHHIECVARLERRAEG